MSTKMDIHEILQHLPHRYPFLLIDRVLECEPGKNGSFIVTFLSATIFFPGSHSRTRSISKNG